MSERKARYLVLFICATMAAAVLGSSLIGIDIGIARLSPYRLLALPLSAGLLWYGFSRLLKGKLSIRHNHALWFVLFWFGYALISFFWVADVNAWFKAIFFLLVGFSTLMGIQAVIREKGDFNHLLNTLVVAVVLVTVLGWLELFTESALLITVDEHNIRFYAARDMPILWFGNANNLAFFLSLGFFIVYIKQQTARRMSVKLLLLLAMAVQTGLILQTRSRAGVLGLLLGLFVLLVYHLLELFRKRNKAFALLVALAVFLLAVPLPRMALSRRSYPVAASQQLDEVAQSIRVDWQDLIEDDRATIQAAADAAATASTQADGTQVAGAALPAPGGASPDDQTQVQAGVQGQQSAQAGQPTAEAGLSSPAPDDLGANGSPAVLEKEADDVGSVPLLKSEVVRLNLIYNGFEILRRTNFIGTGAGNLEHHMSAPDLPRNTNNIVNMHNYWMEVLVTYGPLVFLPMFVGFIWLGIRFLTHAVQRKAGKDRALAIGLAAGMGAFILSSISPSSILSLEFFWPWVGFLLVGSTMLAQAKEAEHQSLPKRVVFMSALDLWSMKDGQGAPSFHNTVKLYIDSGWDVTLVKPVGKRRNWYNLTGYERVGFVNTWLESLFRYRKIGSVARYLSAKYATWQFVRLAGDALERKPGVIYAYEVDAVEAGRRLGLMYNLPLVTRFQGTIMADHPDTLINRLRYYPHIQALRQKSDMVIMTDDGTLGDKVLGDYGNRSHPIHFWRNGVERFEQVDDAASMREKLGINAGTTVLLTVSRVVKWKRIDRAVRALAAVVSGHPDTVLIVVGDGDEKPALERLAADLGISSKVIFAGSVPHHLLVGYYAMADIFLSLYDLSNVGNPLMEAMLMGKAILTINNGDTKSLMGDSERGLMLESTDQELINRGLDILLSDAALAKQYGDAAKAYADQHFWTWKERMTTELREVSKLLRRGDSADE